MYKVPVQPIPNQLFSVMIGNVDYQVELRTIQDTAFMSVWANGDILFYNQLCTPNNFVNPYNYVSKNGKFYWKSLDGEYPYFKNFGNTQHLLFLTAEEVANAEA